MDEAQQQARIAVHRAGNVADHDEGPGANLSFLTAQLERNAAVAQRAAQRGPRIDELAVFGAYSAPRLAGAEPPGESLDDAACLGDLVSCALGEILAAQRLPRAEEHDIVRGGLELLLVRSGMVFALADVEDVFLVFSALGRVPLLRLLLAGVG